jgi:transcriptional regulator with XRE-family HTH domain
MSTLHERLRFLRGEEAQDTFSAKIGVKQTTWGRYERGESQPDAEVIQRICAVLSIEPRWLLLGEGEPAEKVDGQSTDAYLRCIKLETELVLERENSRKKDEVVIDMLRKIEESFQFRLENMKLQMHLDTAQRMCKEFQAENAELKQRLSHFINGEKSKRNTA